LIYLIAIKGKDMNKESYMLKERLIKSFFRIKHLSLTLHTGTDSSIAELKLMGAIQGNSLDCDNNVHISDIQNLLYISKAGVSKMLGVLEKKGYIARDVDKNNRRTLIITLTQDGKKILNELEKSADEQLIEIIDRLGEEKTEQFIELVNKFVDITNDVAKQDIKQNLV